MNALASECSSGCESGWTLYLEEHSFNASHRGSQFIIGGDDDECYVENKAKNEEDSAAGEEDLSMVSDASSGPPHFPDHHHQSYSNAVQDYSASKATAKLAKRSKKRQKVKENQHLLEDDDRHLPSFLDDTASSPVFGSFSMNNVSVTNQQTSTESMLDYSQGFSATYFEERSSLQDHFGFLQPSLSENGAHNKKRDPRCKTTLVFYNHLYPKMELITRSKQMLLLYTGRKSLNS